jgi:hypothetical protein
MCGTLSTRPLLATAFEVPRRERLAEGLEPGRGGARQKHVPDLPEADALGLHPARQPVMLIETQPRRERKVRADADEHPAPDAVEQVEVVLDRLAPLELRMPAVVFADGKKGRRLAGSEDNDDAIGFCPGEVPIDELVAGASMMEMSHWRPVQ